MSNDSQCNTSLVDKDVVSSPNEGGVLKMLRPTSAMPVNNFKNNRYRQQIRKDLELTEQDYPFNDNISNTK